MTLNEDRKQTKSGHMRREHMTHTTEPWHNSPLPEGSSRALTVPSGRGGGRSGGPSGQTRTGTQGPPCPLVAEMEAVAEGPCKGPWLLVIPVLNNYHITKQNTAVDHSGNNTVLRIKCKLFERGHFYKFNYYFLLWTICKHILCEISYSGQY